MKEGGFQPYKMITFGDPKFPLSFWPVYPDSMVFGEDKILLYKN